MSSSNTNCTVCNKKPATKKLSILVDDEHFDKGMSEMRGLLRKFREQYQAEEQEQEQPPTQNNPPPRPALVDKHGIKKIYTDSNPSQVIFMEDNLAGPLFRNEENANLRKGSGGGWTVTGTQQKAQVRLELWQDNPIRDCEITVYAKYIDEYGPGLKDPSAYVFQLYRGGGSHSSTKHNGSEGAAYKGRIRRDRSVVICKEVRHPDYTSNKGNIKKLSKDPKGNFIGAKLVVYNLKDKTSDGRVPVKIEVWCDESGMDSEGGFHSEKQNWQKYAEYVDRGGWSAAGNNGVTGTPPIEIGNNTGNRKVDEILNTPAGAIRNKGNLGAYRTDGALTELKYFSFRKIANPDGGALS